VALLVVFLGGSMLLNVLLFGVAGMAGLASLETKNKVREEFVSHNRQAADKIAVMELEGAILSGEGFIKNQIDRAKKDDNVKAIVLRVNSPGGTVTGSDYIYHHLRELAKEKNVPLVVSMGSVAASGGYYVAMAVGDTPEAIFAEPTTWTGSIGVIIPHYDLSGMLKDLGIEQDSIASHPLKKMGSFTKPMTEKEREIFQELVDQSFSRFKDIVRSGRPKFQENPEALDAVATGQIFTASQAVDNGLVDRIGFLEEAVDRAIELSGVDSKQVKVVRYKPEPSLADVMFGSGAQTRAFDWHALLELTSPRAYYLYTWLPPAVSTRQW